MSVLKKIGLVIGGLIAAYIAIVVFFSLIFWTNDYLRAKQLRQQVVNVEQWLAEQQKAQEKMYREDTYGGKTPEETWAMFISALEKEDVELASKYFVVGKQGEWKKTWEKVIAEKRLDNVLNEFKSFSKSSEKSPYQNKEYFYYNGKTKEFGVISSSIIFTLNPYTKVWKISVL